MSSESIGKLFSVLELDDETLSLDETFLNAGTKSYDIEIGGSKLVKVKKPSSVKSRVLKCCMALLSLAIFILFFYF